MGKRILACMALLGLVTALVVSIPITASAKDSSLKRAAKGELRSAKVGTGSAQKDAPFFSAGILAAAAEALDNGERADNLSGAGTFAIGGTTLGCGQRNTAANVRVNQDCTFRRQPEKPTQQSGRAAPPWWWLRTTPGPQPKTKS